MAFHSLLFLQGANDSSAALSFISNSLTSSMSFVTVPNLRRKSDMESSAYDMQMRCLSSSSCVLYVFTFSDVFFFCGFSGMPGSAFLFLLPAHLPSLSFAEYFSFCLL